MGMVVTSAQGPRREEQNCYVTHTGLSLMCHPHQVTMEGEHFSYLSLDSSHQLRSSKENQALCLLIETAVWG
jgi:hypothetical protein